MKAAAIPQHLFDAQRFAHGSFNCDLCGAEYPIAHLRAQPGNDGSGSWSFVGRFCCYEPGGSSIDRDLHLAYAKAQASRLTADEAQPPSFDGQTATGPDTIAFYPSSVDNVDPSPIVLTRGGVAVSVSLTGNGFTSSDTIAYGSGGLTDATPPVLVSDTSRTLSVQASGIMNAGRYSFTFNGTKWPQLFDVR